MINKLVNILGGACQIARHPITSVKYVAAKTSMTTQENIFGLRKGTDYINYDLISDKKNSSDSKKLEEALRKNVSEILDKEENIDEESSLNEGPNIDEQSNIEEESSLNEEENIDEQSNIEEESSLNEGSNIDEQSNIEEESNTDKQVDLMNQIVEEMRNLSKRLGTIHDSPKLESKGKNLGETTVSSENSSDLNNKKSESKIVDTIVLNGRAIEMDDPKVQIILSYKLKIEDKINEKRENKEKLKELKREKKEILHEINKSYKSGVSKEALEVLIGEFSSVKCDIVKCENKDKELEYNINEFKKMIEIIKSEISEGQIQEQELEEKRKLELKLDELREQKARKLIKNYLQKKDDLNLLTTEIEKIDMKISEKLKEIEDIFLLVTQKKENLDKNLNYYNKLFNDVCKGDINSDFTLQFGINYKKKEETIQDEINILTEEIEDLKEEIEKYISIGKDYTQYYNVLKEEIEKMESSQTIKKFNNGEYSEYKLEDTDETKKKKL